MALQRPPTPIKLPKPPVGYINDPVNGTPIRDPGYDPRNASSGNYPTGQGQVWSLPISGRYTTSQAAYEAELRQAEMQRQQAERSQQAFNAQKSALGGLQGAMSGGGGSFGVMQGGGGGGSSTIGTTPAVQYPSVSMSPVPDASAAQSAAFGAAKAKAGALGRSAVDSLQSTLAERGIMGGGTEARGLVDRLAGATNPLSDLNVAQQGESLGIARHNQDLGAQQAAQMYSGGITQRGQDIQSQQFQAQLEQQRYLQQQQQQQQMLQQALAGLSRMY